MERSPIDIGTLVRETGHITRHDVWYFREEVFRDGVVSREEAEAIFALDSAIEDKCPEWSEFFIEALTDFIVDEAEPRGYVSLLNAEWLISRVSHDGHLGTMTELELLVKVLNRAKSSPDILVNFTMKEIMRAAKQGEQMLANEGRPGIGVMFEASKLMDMLGRDRAEDEDGKKLLRFLADTGTEAVPALARSPKKSA